jgi:hypothetical protein
VFFGELAAVLDGFKYHAQPAAGADWGRRVGFAWRAVGGGGPGG